MKKKFFILSFSIITSLYALYLFNHFKGNDQTKKASVYFDLETFKKDLIDNNKTNNLSFLHDGKKKSTYLLLNGYAKEGFEAIGYLYSISGNRDEEIRAWYYSGMLMMADVEMTALRKMDLVEKAVKGIKETYNLFSDNFVVCCILSESLLSLPSFFPDEIDYGIKILEETVYKIKTGYKFTMRDENLKSIECNDFEYIRQLVDKAKKCGRCKEKVNEISLIVKEIL